MHFGEVMLTLVVPTRACGDGVYYPSGGVLLPYWNTQRHRKSFTLWYAQQWFAQPPSNSGVQHGVRGLNLVMLVEGGPFLLFQATAMRCHVQSSVIITFGVKAKPGSLVVMGG